MELDAIKKEPVDDADDSTVSAAPKTERDDDVTSSNVGSVITDELDIKVEYESDESEQAVDAGDGGDRPPVKRGPSTSPDAVRKKPRRDAVGFEADYEAHRRLCELEIELLKALIEKERVEADYNRTVFELKTRRLDLKMRSRET